MPGAAGLATLLALARAAAPVPRRLPNGLGVWVEVQPPRRDGLPRPLVAAGGAAPRAEPAPITGPAETTLGASRQSSIRGTLAAQGGNVAATARVLGVSRGLVYRAVRGA